jgi:RNA polymerase sigma-70 factor (ECF subfamily)
MIIAQQICDRYDDLELVRKSLEEVDWFSCLYERYEQRLKRYLKTFAGLTDAEAQDVLQEAFIKVWLNLNGYDPSFSFSAWVYRIVHNEAISALRKRKSYGKDKTLELNEELVEAFISDLGDEDQADKMVLEESLVKEALRGIADKYKDVLVLRYLEGMSYSEISDVLKIPEGTVATRINRAKRAFIEFVKNNGLSFEKYRGL